MGANHSFDASILEEPYWDQTITSLLDKGYWVSLDYQAHQHKDVLNILNPVTWQSRMFVPLLSVRIPFVQTSSTNLTVKIDDIDFNATNPGVWCMHFREVTDSNRFTDWNEYGTDVVIKEEALAPVVHRSTPVINDQEIGLDPDAVSKLKPENEETKISANTFIASPEIAAEAYAEGATTDPLSSKTKKAIKK